MNHRHRKVPAALAALAAVSLLAGCAPGAKEPKAKLTEHQRDSVLATEPLPGASTVGEAMKASDQAAEQARRTSEAVDSLPR